MCLGPLPQDWEDAFKTKSSLLPQGTDFGLTAAGVGRSQVFGLLRSAAGIGVGSIDLASGVLTKLSQFGQHSGGLGWITFEAPWLVWQQLDSDSRPGWSLIALNIDTREEITLSRDPPLGTQSAVLGIPPVPAIQSGVVAWSEPTTSTGGVAVNQIVAYNLGTRKSQVLDTGVTSSPVYAGKYLIWARKGANDTVSFAAVTGGDLQRVETAGLLPNPTGATYLAGSDRYLAWTTADLAEVDYVDLTTALLTQMVVTADLKHRVQFPVIVADYLLWYTGDRFSVLDLRSGRGFDIMGSASAANGMLAKSESVGSTPVKGQIGQSRVSALDVSKVSGLPSTGCS